MKIATIYFKSGNKMSIVCESLEIELDQELNKKGLKMIKPDLSNWMFELDQIEAYVVKERRTFWSKWF